MFNQLVNAALVRAELNPDRWSTHHTHWAIREEGVEKTGLAGHICWETDLKLWWATEGDIFTNWVSLEGPLKTYEKEIAEYTHQRLLSWPADTCSIFLAARLTADIDEVHGLRLLTKHGSIDYTKGLIKGYEIGLG